MTVILGIIIVIGSVAGGFVLSHGHLAALWQPYELLVIGGAAFGAFIISNPSVVIKAALGGLPLLLKGSPYTKDYLIDVLCVMYQLMNKARKQGILTLESDAENPHDSELFQRYPLVGNDHHVIEFLTDYLRMLSSGSISNAFELEALLDVELETHHEEAHKPEAAINRIADGLPGFGIVAAVLGIVITMGSLGGSTAEIGAHVAAALVGTFLGILLAYGFVGPMATLMGHHAAAQGQVFKCIKCILVAWMQGYSPQVAVEFGRKSLESPERPGFLELEERLKGQ
ncbi:MAG: flagellar motor stator protein MotA [Gammaproteobacteria bacterium]|jgi:chemotaxis protein MotA